MLSGMTEPDIIPVSVQGRLRAVLPRVRMWLINGACAVAVVDLIMSALAGPCCPKPDVFDLAYLAAACVLLMLQATIIVLAWKRRASCDHAMSECRAELWYGLLVFAVFCAQVATVRFPYVHPGCS